MFVKFHCLGKTGRIELFLFNGLNAQPDSNPKR